MEKAQCIIEHAIHTVHLLRIYTMDFHPPSALLRGGRAEEGKRFCYSGEV